MIGLCHVGMHAKNPARLTAFYRHVLGLQVFALLSGARRG